LHTFDTLLVVLEDDDVEDEDEDPDVEVLDDELPDDELLELDVLPPVVVPVVEELELVEVVVPPVVELEEDEDEEEVLPKPEPENPVVDVDELLDDEELLELELVEPVVDEEVVGTGEGGGDGGAGVGTGGGVAETVATSGITVQSLSEKGGGEDVSQPWLTTSRIFLVTFAPVSVTPFQMTSEGSLSQPMRRLCAMAMTT
jgi:hypothetical protein